MTETLSYHGQANAEEYKQGERMFRFLSKAIQAYPNIRIGVMWPDIEKQKYIKVIGPLSRVYREYNGMPYADLAYLEYDEEIDVRSWLSSSTDPISSLAEEMMLNLEFISLAVEAEATLGNVPEGIYAEGPASFSLGDLPIFSFGYSI